MREARPFGSGLGRSPENTDLVDVLPGDESGGALHRSIDDCDLCAIVIACHDLHRSLVVDLLCFDVLLHITHNSFHSARLLLVRRMQVRLLIRIHRNAVLISYRHQLVSDNWLHWRLTSYDYER